jgi:hypothetical protein
MAVLELFLTRCGVLFLSLKLQASRRCEALIKFRKFAFVI